MAATAVTATQTGGTANGLLVRLLVLTGTAATQNGASGSQTSWGGSGHQVTLTTTEAGSITWSVEINSTNAYPSPVAGNTVIDGVLDNTLDRTYGTFRQTTPTVTPGSFAAGSTDSWNGGLAALEILPAVPGGTIATDASGPAVAYTLTATTVTTASFTPPAGALLVALVSSNGMNAQTTVSVSDTTSLSWTQASVSNSIGNEYAGIWLAQVAGGGPGLGTGGATGTGSMTATGHKGSSGSSKVAGTGTVTASTTGVSPGGAMHILVPAYSYPASGAASPYWEALYAAAPTMKYLVADVNSGNLGGSPDTDYQAAINAALATPGITVVGYVDTEHASTPLATIETNIGLYNTYYGVTSIFLDNASTDTGDIGYYTTLCNLIHETPGAVTVLNHGVTPDQAYAAIGDVMIVFEGPSYPDGTGIGDWQSALAGTIPDIPQLPASWFASYGPGRFCAIIYETTPSAGLDGGTPEAWQTVLAQAQGIGVGVVYLTDATYAGNPYDVLPSYWAAEVAAVAAAGPTGVPAAASGTGTLTPAGPQGRC